jgi:hypothetical protein
LRNVNLPVRRMDCQPVSRLCPGGVWHRVGRCPRSACG